MEPAPPAEKKGKLRRRSSILKLPVPTSPDEETEELTSRRASRRVSFANRFHVQEFCSDEVTVTRWAGAYEQEAHVTDSSGEASAAALAASRTALLDTTQHLNASMDLTGMENSFVLAPVTSFPALAGGSGSSNAFEAALGPVPSFLREDSDPDKENMAPRPQATSVAGVGVKAPLLAATESGWLVPSHCVASPPPSAPRGGLLELLGGSNVATPPFLRQPAPGGVLDLLRRAGVVSQSPSATTPATWESGRSALELLSGAEKVDTPPFLRYLDALDDHVSLQGRVENDSLRENADMEITMPAASLRLATAASSAMVEVSQMELTGSSTQTVWSPSGPASVGPNVTSAVGGVDDALDRGPPWVCRPVAVGNRTVVDSADMELTSALPRGLPLQPASSLNKSVVDGADMELTAAVPQAMAKASSRLNQTIADGGDMELTAAVPQVMQKSLSRLDKSIVEGADMELTAAALQTVAKPPGYLNKSIVDCADMELTAAVPQAVQKPPSRLNKSIVDCADMELTAAVPQAVQKPSSRLNKSIVDCADMELTAAVPQAVQKPSSRLNKSIVDCADMELTAAVPQAVQKPPSRVNKSIVDCADMELTAAVPQAVQKPPSRLNKSIVDCAGMELTAAVSQAVQKPSSRLNKSIVDCADMELTAAVPQVMSSSLKNKTVVGSADMELTAAAPRSVTRPSGQLNQSLVNGADMELTAAAPQETEKPSNRLGKTVMDDADMVLTAAIPQASAPKLSNANRAMGDGADVETTVPRETVPNSTKRVNKTVVDEEDMEVTAAVPPAVTNPSQGSKTLIDGADMKEAAAVPQSADPTSSSLMNKTTVEAADMELTAAVQKPVTKPSSRLNKSVVDATDTELTSAVPQVMNGGDNETADPQGVALKPSGQLNKTVVDEAEMEMTAAVPQPVAKLSRQVNKTTIDVADMELTSAVPLPVAKPSVGLNKSIVDGADMELTTAVPQAGVLKHLSQVGEAIVNAADEEVIVQEACVLKSSNQLNKTVVDEADMEMTGAVPQPETVPSRRVNKTLTDVTDMEETAAVPQPMIAKHLGKVNTPITDGADMKVTAAVLEQLVAPKSASEVDMSAIADTDKEVTESISQSVAEPPCQMMSMKNVDASNTEVSAAVPQGSMPQASQMSKTIIGEIEMEMTAAVPQAVSSDVPSQANEEIVEATDVVIAVSPCVVQKSGQMNKTVMDGADMEMTSAVPQQIAKPSSQENRTMVDVADMEETAAVPHQFKPPSQVNSTVTDGADMEMTAAVTQAFFQKPPSGLYESIVNGKDEKLNGISPGKTDLLKLRGHMNKTILDGADMEMTAAVPQPVIPKACKEGKGIAMEAGKEATVDAASQEVLKSSSETKTSAGDLTDMEITSAVPQAIHPKSPTQVNEGMVGGSDISVSRVVTRVSCQTNKTIADAADMEMTGVSSQAVTDPSTQLDSSTSIDPENVDDTDIASVQKFPVESDVDVNQVDKLISSSTSATSSANPGDTEALLGTHDAHERTSSTVMSDPVFSPASPASSRNHEDVKPSTAPDSEDPPLAKSPDTEGVTSTDELLPPAPEGLNRTSACRRPAVDSPRRPSPKRGRLLVHSPTPSPPKRLREEPDDSPLRSPKSPRLEEVLKESSEPSSESLVDGSLENASGMSFVSDERHESGGVKGRLSAGDSELGSVINLRSEESGGNPSEGGLSSRRASEMRPVSAYVEEGLAAPQLEHPLPSPRLKESPESLRREWSSLSTGKGGHSNLCAAKPDSLEQHPASPLPVIADSGLQQEVHSASLVQEVRPASPVQEVRPVSPVQEVRPASPVQEVRSASPVQEVHPASPVQELRPASPVSKVYPARPVQEMHPASQAKEVRRAGPVQEVRPASPMQEVRLANPIREVPPAGVQREVHSASPSPVLQQNVRPPSPKHRVRSSLPREESPVSPRPERHLSSLGRVGLQPTLADVTVSEMFAGTPLQTGAGLDLDLIDEPFPDISVLNDSFCGAGQRPAARPSAAHDVIRRAAERDPSCRTNSRFGRPEHDVVQMQTQQRPSLPREESPPWRRHHGGSEQRHSRLPAEERKRSQLVDESPRSRGHLASPKRKGPQPLDEASDRPVGFSRVRRSEAVESRQFADARRPSAAAEGQDLTSTLRLPPPLRLPDCRALVRGLKAHLEAYRSAREASERAVLEDVEAFLARCSSV